MTSLLSVQNLSVQFRVQKNFVTAVNNFSLELEPGECVGLVGESGCGKTTTGLSIMRLLPSNGHISSGKVLLNDVDLASLSEDEMCRHRGKSIALIPQDPMSSLNPTMKIGRQIGEGLRIHDGASDAQARQRALEVLEMVEMPRPEERLDQYPFELSGGLRQRVIIAMGLVNSPSLLIADEPTTALDVTIQAQILDILDTLRSELKMAMLLITHDMGVIAGRSDRVVVMYAGQKAEEARTQRLFSGMRHPYTQALLASMPSMENTSKHRLASIAGMPPNLSNEIVGCRFAPRCSHATDQCRQNEPALTGVDHVFACFNPVDGPAPVVVRSGGDATAQQVKTRPEILRAQGIVKEFPIKRGVIRHKVGAVHAVSDVTFSLHQGETFGLVGESGCGKTTIGRMLVGLEALTAGEVYFDDQLVSAQGYKPSRVSRRDRQMMFQDPYSSLDPRMKVEGILGEPLAIQGIGSRKEQNQRVAELLSSVGLDPQVADRYPHEFSGGQRQRIGLARALALNPRLIVADEPVSALDVSVQAQILNLMKDLQAQYGMTYVMVSHDLAVVYYMADTIAVMYLGKIVEIGDAESVFRSPAHPYTQGLLDSVPTPDPTVAREARASVVGELPSAVNPPSGCRFRTRCQFAQEICTNEEPAFQDFGATQRAACHFPLKTPLKTPVAIGSQPAAD